MPSPKKQPTKSRIRSSLKAYAKTPNGHVFFRAIGIGAIVMGAFLSLFSFAGSFVAGFEGSTSNAFLLFVLSIVLLIFSIAGCVVAIANNAALRKTRGHRSSLSVTPQWLSTVYATIAATLIIGAVAAAIYFYLFAG